jgi:hypothetical protein
MDQKKDNTKRFKSYSTGEPCTAAQYVAEMVCMRRRERENNGSLAFKFWNKAQKDEYQTQIRAANTAIKRYGEKALLHYLKSPNGKRTYSLGYLNKNKKFIILNKFVKEGLEKSKKIIEEEAKKAKKVIEADNMVFRPRTNRPARNSLLSKLRKADNGKE